MPRPSPRLLPLLLCLLAAPLAGQQRADLVLLNGRVFTADPLQPSAEAFAMRDGRIVAVGATADLRGSEATRVVDVGGRVVIPGINDAHMHIGPDDDAIHVRLGSNDPSLATLADSIGAAAERAPGSVLVAAVGETILGQALATRALLDRVAPYNPVRLEGWTGHGLVINRAAEISVSFAGGFPSDYGGWYELADDETVIAAWGYPKFLEDIRSIEGVSDSVARLALATQAMDASRFGITTMQSMPLPLLPSRIPRLTERMDLPVRLRIIGYGDPLRTTAPLPGVHPARERVYASGVKWFADGTPVERYALLGVPYADRAGWYGRPYLDYDMLRRAASAAARARAQPIFHAAGDSTIALVFRALREAAPDSTWRRLRPRIEHGDFLRADQLDDARALGVVLVQNPAHLMIPDIIGARVGARMPQTQLLASVRRAGVPLALGSDGPVNPFLNIMFATMHPGNPAEALTREEAVTALTYGSAYAEGIDDKGMIAVGMLADVAVLSQDIFTIPAQALPGTVSVLTIVDGRVVHEAPEL